MDMKKEIERMLEETPKRNESYKLLESLIEPLEIAKKMYSSGEKEVYHVITRRLNNSLTKNGLDVHFQDVSVRENDVFKVLEAIPHEEVTLVSYYEKEENTTIENLKKLFNNAGIQHGKTHLEGVKTFYTFFPYKKPILKGLLNRTNLCTMVLSIAKYLTTKDCLSELHIDNLDSKKVYHVIHIDPLNKHSLEPIADTLELIRTAIIM